MNEIEFETRVYRRYRVSQNGQIYYFFGGGFVSSELKSVEEARARCGTSVLAAEFIAAYNLNYHKLKLHPVEAF